MRIAISAALTGLCVLAATSLAEPPPLPPTPAPVLDVVYARPFALEQGYEFTWRKEKPLVTEGYLLVLKVNPALVYPRQSAEPVLYVGDTTAERVNVGYPSGHLVVIVPGKLADFDLKKTLIWFGTPDLPERCTAKTIAEEREKALKDSQEFAALRDTLFDDLAVALKMLTDEDSDYIIDTCYSVTMRNTGGVWSPLWNKAAKREQFADINMPQMLTIVGTILEEQLHSFFQ